MRLKRTKTCGELRASDVGAGIVLSGWIASWRDHGGIRFLNLRDRYGITQVVVDELSPKETHVTAASLRDEYCIAVAGVVQRPPTLTVRPLQLLLAHLHPSASQLS